MAFEPLTPSSSCCTWWRRCQSLQQVMENILTRAHLGLGGSGSFCGGAAGGLPPPRLLRQPVQARYVPQQLGASLLRRTEAKAFSLVAVGLLDICAGCILGQQCESQLLPLCGQEICAGRCKSTSCKAAAACSAWHRMTRWRALTVRVMAVPWSTETCAGRRQHCVPSYTKAHLQHDAPRRRARSVQREIPHHTRQAVELLVLRSGRRYHPAGN